MCENNDSINSEDECGELGFTGIPFMVRHKRLEEKTELMALENNANVVANQSGSSMVKIHSKMMEKIAKIEEELLSMGNKIGKLQGENDKLKEEMMVKFNSLDEKITEKSSACIPAMKKRIQAFWIKWFRPFGATLWEERTNILLLLLFLGLIVHFFHSRFTAFEIQKIKQRLNDRNRNYY